MSAMDPSVGGALAFMRSTFTPKRVLGEMAVSAGLAGSIGFVGSGGEPRGAVAGIGGGIKGSLSGGIKGALLLGAVGAAFGLGLATPYGRKAMMGFAEKHATWFGSKVMPKALINPALKGDGMSAFMNAAEQFSTADMGTLVGLSALGGAAAGLSIGSPLGGALGAWSAGRNVRSSTAYNSFSGIGM